MSATDALTDSQFVAVEEAMAQTDLGRSFLDEFARRSSMVRAAEVMDVLGEVRQSLQAQSSSTHVEILRRQLQEMSASIVQTRTEIAAIKPDEPGNNRIMAATEDLDAIVTATERATNDILSAAERIQEICENLREQGSEADLLDSLEEDITNIFLACSFQDITGQRITKVVKSVTYVEDRVNALISVWGKDEIDRIEVKADVEKTDDEKLLRGPALEGEGISQDEIDKLFD